MVRVGVDPVTGMVHVLEAEAHNAAGTVSTRGLGSARSKAVSCRDSACRSPKIHSSEGRSRHQTNFDTYMVPTIRDVPTMHVTALEDLDAGDPYGPRGVGELGLASITPAIANAVGDATGIRPLAAPFDPAILAGYDRCELSP